jgi:DNA-binding Lrp family transcriptional regulator
MFVFMVKKPNRVRNDAADAPLDRTDRRILAELQNDARLSNKELAARAGLAPSSCLERVRRLSRRGVLRGFHADIDPAALGAGLQALVGVKLQRHSLAAVRSVRGHLLSLPELVAMYHLGGTSDFLLHVAVRDVSHLRDFIVDALTTRPEVAHVETSLIFEHVRGRGLRAEAVPGDGSDKPR